VSALLDATYVCVGFNIVTRVANALGFKVPSEELLFRAARLLRLFGYRRLSGFWILGSSNREMYANRALSTDWAELDSASINTHLDDPYANKMECLRYAVVSSPGSLAPNIRQAISEGAYSSTPLGAFAQKVAEHAFMVNDDDIRELHRAHYSDDQIFEAAVSAALGAGLYRLERVLAVLRANQPAITTHGELPAQNPSASKAWDERRRIPPKLLPDQRSS
jgi:alkylhydroperoxidase family enzyme